MATANEIMTYEFMLREKYAGSRVSGCKSSGIETIPFGIELGKEPAPCGT